MNDSMDGDDERGRGKGNFGKKDKSKKDKKDKGYVMFEEEDSEEEPILQDDTRSPAKIKKHKPSFKFTKREKLYKPKEKDKDREKEEKKEKERREKEDREKRERKEKEDREKRERKEKEEKERKEKEEKEQKKKEKTLKLKLKKNKFLSGSKQSLNSQSSALGATAAAVAAPDDPHTVFGVPLQLAVDRSKCHDGLELPVVFRACIDYIEEYGLTCEGIYRISGVKSKVQHLKELFNKGEPSVPLFEYEPSIVASLLKQYLREMPEPILTKELNPKFEQTSTVKNVRHLVEEFKKLINALPTPNRLLLSWMIVHMTHIIALEKQNKMSLQNVSIVLSPTMQISHRVLNVFFTYAKILFRDTVIKKYVPPLRPVSSRWSLELPDSPSAIEEELNKQESLLDQLHAELALVTDNEKEERLWEVQRMVTGLKRKLKFAKKAHDAAAQTAKKDDDLAQEKLAAVHKHQLRLNMESKSDCHVFEESKPKNKDESKSKSREAKSSPQLTTPLTVETEKEDGIVKDVKKKEDGAEERKKDESELKKDGVGDAALEKEVVQTEEKGNDGVKDETVEEENVQSKAPETEMDKGTKLKSETTEAKEKEEEPEDDRDLATPTLDSEVPVEDTEDSDTEPIEEGPEIPEVPQPSKAPEEIAEAPVEEMEKLTIQEEKQEEEEAKEDTAKAATPDAIDDNVFEEEEDKIELVIKEGDVAEENKKEIAESKEPPAEESKQDHGDSFATKVIQDEVKLEEVPVEAQPDQVKPAREREEMRQKRDEEEGPVISPHIESATAPFSILKPVKLYDDKISDPLDYYQQAANFEDDEEYLDLLRQHTALLLEEEELIDTESELRQKIESEWSEIKRLKQDIADMKEIRKNLYSSDEEEDDDDDDDKEKESDDSDEDEGSSDESLDEDILLEMLQQITKENKELERRNAELVENTHRERKVCLGVKIEIRMLQHRQTQSSQQAIESLL